MTVDPGREALDSVQLAVMANRIDAIVREMTSTVLLTASSSVIAMARDFSCAILTSDHDILGTAEALPVHAFGSNLQSRAMALLHPDFAEGDAFLNNDPYSGNTHPADHSILVPVFCENEHVFTTVVKAHQADCGNGLPTTYNPYARDVYDEGALVFPVVRIQQNEKDNDDIVNMCRRRIRVPEQWYGDYLASVTAARSGERALKDFVGKYGLATVRRFIAGWLDYSERRAEAAIRRLPAANIVHSGRLDALGDFMAEPIDVKVEIAVDPEAGMITVDLRDNIDCVDTGINQSEATATGMAIAGVMNCLEDRLPLNSGTFRRIRVLLRENCVVGIPCFPHSCSTATTLLADVIGNTIQAALAGLGDGFGLSEGNINLSVGQAVISGRDPRKGGAEFVNQLFLMGGGGPASPTTDGMHGFSTAGGAGVCFRDSIEVDELRYPILVNGIGLVPGSAGAGRRRGGLATRVEFTSRADSLTYANISASPVTPPRGVQQGCDAFVGVNRKVSPSGQVEPLPPAIIGVLRQGERLIGHDCGGGGYGDPATREPQRVLADVQEGYETVERARDVYRVAIVLEDDGVTCGIDEEATAALRAATKKT
jgi:N-methylhydantoinase B/oxoprolinase/acetone carboxylase alpha subunit